MSTPDTEDTAADVARDGKSAQAFRTISEVASELDLPQHVLRFWETKFPSVKPMKRGGGRRYYRPEDVALLARIRGLLYADGYTIKGVQKLIRERGIKGLLSEETGGGEPAPMPPAEAIATPATPDTIKAEVRSAIAELTAIKSMLEA